MILWRYLEVIESNSLGCLILEEKAVYSSPHFLVSPLTVLCLGSQWYYFLLGACLLVGSASGKGRLTACLCSCWCWWLRSASLPLFAVSRWPSLVSPIGSRSGTPLSGPGFLPQWAFNSLFRCLAFRARFNRARDGIAFLGSQEKWSYSSSHWEFVATRTALNQGKPSPFSLTLDYMQLLLYDHFWW